jgi:hypothetical protein
MHASRSFSVPSTLLQMCCFINYRSKLTVAVISLATERRTSTVQNFVLLCDFFPKSRHRYVVQTGLFSRNVCTPLPATDYKKIKRFTGLKKWLKLVKFTGLTILQANLVKINTQKSKGLVFLFFLINSFKNVHTILLLFFLIILFNIFLLSSFSASSFSLPHSPSHSSFYSSLSPPPHPSYSSSLSSLKFL